MIKIEDLNVYRFYFNKLEVKTIEKGEGFFYGKNIIIIEFFHKNSYLKNFLLKSI